MVSVEQNNFTLAFLTKAKFAIFGVKKSKRYENNDVKNLSDMKTFFQRYDCKLTYNDYYSQL
jgi:hypothetical protein